MYGPDELKTGQKRGKGNKNLKLRRNMADATCNIVALVTKGRRFDDENIPNETFNRNISSGIQAIDTQSPTKHAKAMLESHIKIKFLNVVH